MTMATDPVIVMKQEVGKAAASRVTSNSIVGLGTGSTTAYAIEYIGDRLKKGEITNILGIPTSFQAEVLAKKYGIPLTTLLMQSIISMSRSMARMRSILKRI